MPLRRPRLPLVALLASSPGACIPVATPAQESAAASAPVADPMASFAGMVEGEWRVTMQSGTGQYTTSHWGPGRHSVRSLTHGEDGGGNPWRDVEFLYWHPGLGQIRLLGVGSFARSVSEGVLRRDGANSEAVLDTWQTSGRRRLVSRSRSDGPDQSHGTLLERTSSGELVPLIEIDAVRHRTITPIAPLPAEGAPRPSELLAPLEPLLRHAWEAEGPWPDGSARRLRTDFEWIPYADAVVARTVALAPDREPLHLLDALLYHHTGAGTLRCLALSSSGGVYEGDVSVLEGGALRLDLKHFEAARADAQLARLDFEPDGTLRQRIWSVDGSEQTLRLDVRHARLASPGK